MTEASAGIANASQTRVAAARVVCVRLVKGADANSLCFVENDRSLLACTHTFINIR